MKGNFTHPLFSISFNEETYASADCVSTALITSVYMWSVSSVLFDLIALNLGEGEEVAVEGEEGLVGLLLPLLLPPPYMRHTSASLFCRERYPNEYNID